jgi:two-component sensor histidine kinase
VEPLAQSVLAEALRNAHKHARPSSVRVHVGQVDRTFVLEVRNDGTPTRGTRGAGMGLRLAAVEALQRGALVEFGPEGEDWRLRLVVPLGEDGTE